MSETMTATDVFEQEFLPLRAKLLEVAAMLDRLDRADGSVAADRRLAQVRAAIETLLQPDNDRAEQIQLLFSRAYEDDWREKFQMTNDE